MLKDHSISILIPNSMFAFSCSVCRRRKTLIHSSSIRTIRIDVLFFGGTNLWEREYYTSCILLTILCQNQPHSKLTLLTLQISYLFLTENRGYKEQLNVGNQISSLLLKVNPDNPFLCVNISLLSSVVLWMKIICCMRAIFFL